MSPGFIESLEKNLPAELEENPFDHIIQQCTTYFSADYGSYLAPDKDTMHWQVKTCLKSEQGRMDIIDYPIEVELEPHHAWMKPDIETSAFPPEIKKGLCNLAIRRGEIICAENVKDHPEYSAHYLEHFKDAAHEIIIPVTAYDAGEETLIGAVVLDFCDLATYRCARDKIQAESSLMLRLGHFIFRHVYAKAAKLWDQILLDISRLNRIDFDQPADVAGLNQILSGLWPGLVYYSVWVQSSDSTSKSVPLSFVRIGHSFLDPEIEKRYQEETEIVDYIFSDSVGKTYRNILMGLLNKDHAGKYINGNRIFRKRMSRETHRAISDKFNRYLYGEHPGTFRDFHFIPILAKEPGNNSYSSEIAGIIFFFFQDIGDRYIIPDTRIEWLAQLIHDRVQFGRHRKITQLWNRIQKHTAGIFKDFPLYMKQIAQDLLQMVPSQSVEILLIKDWIEAYTFDQTKKAFQHLKDIDKTVVDHILQNCLKDKMAMISHKKDHNVFERMCKHCHQSKGPYDFLSCLAVKVLDPNEKKRAVILFRNRIKPSVSAIQAFSILDSNAVFDISPFLGLIISFFEAREEERKLKTVFRHELSAPVHILSNKLRDVENTVAKEVFPLLGNEKQTVKALLDKKIKDCWYSCDTLTYQAQNYIRFIKQDSNITPESVNLPDMMEHILHLFKLKFNKAKQIYILVEGMALYQEIQGHKPMIFSALHNIFDNAYKYSHRYSVFHVRIREDATHVVMTFVNYGIGMGEKELKSVFDLYYQSGQIRKELEGEVSWSHGIGLSLARWYVEECHQGRIFFEYSRPLAPFNPFFLFLVKNIYLQRGVFEDTYRDTPSMLHAEPAESIRAYFRNGDIWNFFKKVRPLGRLGEFLFKNILEVPTWENKLVLVLPKQFKG